MAVIVSSYGLMRDTYTPCSLTYTAHEPPSSPDSQGWAAVPKDCLKSMPLHQGISAEDIDVDG